MLPRVKINFDNGALASVVPSADGTFGLLAHAVAVEDTFALNKAYVLKGTKDISKLGISPSADNYRLHKTLTEFYKEAGEGTELWLMGMEKSTKVSEWFKPADNGKVPAETLLDSAKGRLRALFTSFSAPADFSPSLTDGLDTDVWAAAAAAQIFAVNYTNQKFAPFLVLLEGIGFDGNVTTAADLNQKQWDRVAIIIGDTEKKTAVGYTNYGAATGVLAGRLAKLPVNANLARVREGALSTSTAYVVDTAAELFDTESLHDKGFISFRFHQGKAGYYFTDDPLATALDNDYKYITRRRTIDKAYRLAYGTLVNYLLEQIPTTADGTLSVPFIKAIEGDVESTIANSMTAAGELSADINDKDDKGVICFIDTNQKVVSNSTLEVVIRVRPFGYARYIDVLLGFQIVNS